MLRYLRLLESFLFAPRHVPFGRFGQPAFVVLRYLYALVRDLVTGDLNMRAMSLVYTTLLSIVPLIAFCLAIVKGLGFHHGFEPLLVEFFRPLGEEGPAFARRVLGFVEHAQGGVLGSLGLAFLLWTVISVVQKVEDALNHIWHVERARSFARRFSEYLSVLIVGPVLMVASFGLIASLETQAAVVWLASHEPFGTLLVMAGKLGPLVIVTTGFALLYTFVPNTTVRLPVAAAAGLAAGAAWVAASFAFARLAAYSTQMMAIYTGFAIVLLALMWIWLNWLILLAGALLGFYLQHPEYLRSGNRDVLPTARLRERLALSVMVLVARAFATGGARPSVASLAETLAVPSIALGPVVDSLEAAGLLETTDREALLPARDPSAITLDAVLAAVRDGANGRALTLREASIVAEADEACGRADAAIRTALGGTSLRDLAAPGGARRARP